jgi:hypothetical protein
VPGRDEIRRIAAPFPLILHLSSACPQGGDYRMDLSDPLPIRRAIRHDDILV